MKILRKKTYNNNRTRKKTRTNNLFDDDDNDNDGFQWIFVQHTQQKVCENLHTLFCVSLIYSIQILIVHWIQLGKRLQSGTKTNK